MKKSRNIHRSLSRCSESNGHNPWPGHADRVTTRPWGGHVTPFSRWWTYSLIVLIGAVVPTIFLLCISLEIGNTVVSSILRIKSRPVWVLHVAASVRPLRHSFLPQMNPLDHVNYAQHSTIKIKINGVAFHTGSSMYKGVTTLTDTNNSSILHGKMKFYNVSL